MSKRSSLFIRQHLRRASVRMYNISIMLIRGNVCPKILYSFWNRNIYTYCRIFFFYLFRVWKKDHRFMVSGNNQHNNGANTQQGENLLSVYGRISPQTLLQSFAPKNAFFFLRRVLTQFFFFLTLGLPISWGNLSSST